MKPMDRHHWPTQTASSSSTSSATISAADAPLTQVVSNLSTSSAVMASSQGPACGLGVSSGLASHDNLIHAVIALSILIGILLLILVGLLLLLCYRRRHSREGSILAENGIPTLASIGGHTGATREGVVSDISAVTDKNGAASVEPVTAEVLSQSSEGAAPAHEESPPEHGEAMIPSKPRLCPCGREIGEADHSLQSASSVARFEVVGTPFLQDEVSVDDFDQGQDVEVHPEVRALVMENILTKEAVGDMKPMQPKAETIIPGYNPKLDEKRPKDIQQFLRDYRILFVIDDSGSMHPHWAETGEALFEIVDYAFRVHSDAVDMRFFNHHFRRRGVRGADEVVAIFNQVQASGGTPTGRVLSEVLDEQLNRLDNAQRLGTYSSERPLDVIVLTDGVPNSDSPPAPIIEAAAKRLKTKGHHPNWIGIQFVQVGDDPAAEPTLLSLIDGDNNDMVDTISYSFYKDEGGGRLTAAVLRRIILGGLHPNLRSYWNQYRRKKYQKTSHPIY